MRQMPGGGPLLGQTDIKGIERENQQAVPSDRHGGSVTCRKHLERFYFDDAIPLRTFK